MALFARQSPDLKATLSDTRSLTYPAGTAGLPSFVRSASALCRWNSRLVIVQDDVHALAVLNPNGHVEPFALPHIEGGAVIFDDAHGNKSAKLDLESALCLPDRRFLAFGSGATPARERIVVIQAVGPARLVDAAGLYAMLRREDEFAGAELNMEGAVLAGDTIHFFQRGAPQTVLLSAASAIGDVSLGAFLRWLDADGPVPELTRVRQIHLGEIRGVRFGFTDATSTLDGRIAFLACAENTADAVSDGPVLGCRFGLIADDDVQTTDVVDVGGRPITLKLEGIENRQDNGACYDVVADQDLPNEPALLGKLTVSRV